MSHSRVQGTLVQSFWPSAPFWPLLVREVWGFVGDYQFLEAALTVRQGRNTNSLLGPPRGLVISLQRDLSFRSILVVAFRHFYTGCAACV